MNRNPALKNFLKGGEVDTYEGIEVEWIFGRKAVMHIYDDGKEVEEVSLYELTTREEIVKKVEEKGFRLKSRQTAMKERILKNDLTLMENSTTTGMYDVFMRTFCAVVIVGLFIVQRRKNKVKRSIHGRQNDLVV